MSDYVRTKAVFYPLDQATLKTIGVADAFDLEFDTRFAPLFESKDNGHCEAFDIECTDSRVYLVYVLYYTYGDECGDFGRSRDLSLAEQEKYSKLFKQIIPDIDANKLRYIDYCYYNCCEAPDYYDIFPDNDDFYEEI